MADDIWIYDFATKTVENITNNPALDIIPMWSGDRIYFLSDRDENKRMNLYVYDLGDEGDPQADGLHRVRHQVPLARPQRTSSSRTAATSTRFDLATEKTAKVPVVIADDMVSGPGKVVKVAGRVTNYEIAPDGKRALFGARGDVFTVPAKYGNTRNLTRTPGVHERASKWSPDGEMDRLHLRHERHGRDLAHGPGRDGRAAPAHDRRRHLQVPDLAGRPTAKKILWNDKMQRLSYRRRRDGKAIDGRGQGRGRRDRPVRLVARQPVDRLRQARGRGHEQDLPLLASTRKKTFAVTDGWYNSGGPSFSTDGKYLFFVSDRDFNPVYSATEWNHAYLAMSRVYFVTLAKDTKSPFEPKSDEVAIKNEHEKPAAGRPRRHATRSPPTRTRRPRRPSVGQGRPRRPQGPHRRPAHRDGQLRRASRPSGDSVYYQKFHGRGAAAWPSCSTTSRSTRKRTSARSTATRSRPTARRCSSAEDGAYAIIDLPKAPIKLEPKLDLSGMEVTLDLRPEWNQIFDECWRQMKDFFYAPNMHGVDWDGHAAALQAAGRGRQPPGRPDLRHRRDDRRAQRPATPTSAAARCPPPPKVKVGMLGAQFERDAKTGYLPDRQDPQGPELGPEPALAADRDRRQRQGRRVHPRRQRPRHATSSPTSTRPSTTRSGKQVTLKVERRARRRRASREVVVVPVETENAALLPHLGRGRTSPRSPRPPAARSATSTSRTWATEGLNEFVKYFYPQLRKKALIIDVRGNGGGNVSPHDHRAADAARWSWSRSARNGAPGPDPGAAVLGPKVCLCDEFSASDGDIFPYRFKTLKLGKLIGKRTWGGVVGIRGSLPLLDGGSLNKPEFAPYAADGKGWIIEGHRRRARHRRRQRPGPGIRRRRRPAQQGHRGHPRGAEDEGPGDPAGPALPDQEK